MDVEVTSEGCKIGFSNDSVFYNTLIFSYLFRFLSFAWIRLRLRDRDRVPFKKKEKTLHLYHRRRIEIEDKAKVVASDWGTESLPR